MTGSSQVNRKGNEMALCMVQREASKVNNNNRIPTVGVGITQRRKGGEWSGSFEGKALDGPLYDARLQLCAVRQECAGGNGREIEKHRCEHRRGAGWPDLWCGAGDIVSKTAVVKLVAEDRTAVDCSRRPAA